MERQLPPSSRRLNLQYFAMQIGFWAMFAGICAYQTPLLLARGFTNAQIGLIVAVRCLSGVFFQPLLGGFADRHPNIPIKRIVCLSLGLSFVFSVLLLFPVGLGGTLVIFAVLGGFEISAYPLMDSLAIQYINAGADIQYSLGRGLGSFAYAVCCIFLGFQVRHFSVETVLLTHLALVAAEIVIVALFPTFRHDRVQRTAPAEKPHSVPALLRLNPRFTLMLLAVLLALTTAMPLSNFLVNIVTDRGGASADLGIALFVMAASELPAAFLFQRLFRRHSAARLLVVSFFFILVKAALLLATGSVLAVYAVQLTQMLGYGLFTPASVFFVNESVPESDRVRGQSLMMVASNGLGGMLGSLLAGQALDLGGVNVMLLVCIACGVLSVLLGLVALRLKPPAKV